MTHATSSGQVEDYEVLEGELGPELNSVVAYQASEEFRAAMLIRAAMNYPPVGRGLLTEPLSNRASNGGYGASIDRS